LRPRTPTRPAPAMIATLLLSPESAAPLPRWLLTLACIAFLLLGAAATLEVRSADSRVPAQAAPPPR
jgi:hypothetical protein